MPLREKATSQPGQAPAALVESRSPADVSPLSSASAVRVALCFGTYPPERNGGADFLARFSGALAAEGVRVAVITSASVGVPDPVPTGVTVHPTVGDWRLRGGGRDSLRAVRRILDDEQIDILHVFFPDSVLQGRYQLPALIGLGRVPLVTTFWNLGLGRRSPLAVRLEALALLARSQVLTSHDPAYLSVLRRLAAGRPVRWLPVGNNVGRSPAASRAELRQRLGLDPDAFYLGYFGQLDKTRGVEEIMAALALLRRTRDVRVVMIGSAGRPERYASVRQAGEALAYYRALPGQYGVEDAVLWTPYLPDGDVAALLAAVDVITLPYRRNSLGRSSLAAALESGKPVVLGGTPEGVAPLKPGLHVELVAPMDAIRLAEVVAALSDDPGRCARLSLGAAEAACHFAWPRIAAAALGAYAAALGRCS